MVADEIQEWYNEWYNIKGGVVKKLNPVLFDEINGGLIPYACEQLDLQEFVGPVISWTVGYRFKPERTTGCWVNVAEDPDEPRYTHVLSISSHNEVKPHKGEWEPLDTDEYIAALSQLDILMHSTHAWREETAMRERQWRQQEASRQRFRWQCAGR